MAKIPDPTQSLKADDLAAFKHMASARAFAEGRVHLGDVYVRMFNNPAVATKVGALGEQLRFHGVLPDDVREIVILRFAFRQGFIYEWSHHQRPAKLAGLSDEAIDLLRQPQIVDSVPDPARATVEAVDAIVARQSIPESVQQRFIAAHGVDGLVEIVALCGLYSLMGYMTTAFDIEIEEGLPKPPFWSE
jgi:4-carboxymuconolactone decarboxylase